MQFTNKKEVQRIFTLKTVKNIKKYNTEKKSLTNIIKSKRKLLTTKFILHLSRLLVKTLLFKHSAQIVEKKVGYIRLMYIV